VCIALLMKLRGEEQFDLHLLLPSTVHANTARITECMQRKSSSRLSALGKRIIRRPKADDGKRLLEAREELAMLFYTRTTLPHLELNLHLQRSYAPLGALIPDHRDCGGAYLDAASERGKDSILQSISGECYAIVTDGWSTRTAVRGALLMNVNICPKDGSAVLWRVEDASGRIKDKLRDVTASTAGHS
jgi:hypothetical protein